MELAWIADTKPQKKSRESNVAGHVYRIGPIFIGSFKYVDEEGGGFWFVNIRGTKLGINGEW